MTRGVDTGGRADGGADDRGRAVQMTRRSRAVPSWTVAAGALFALVPARLALRGAASIQVAAAAAGAVLAATGVALIRAGWPRRRQSETARLLSSVGFFLVCAGKVGMLAGVGLYH